MPSSRRKKKLIVIALGIVALGCCVMAGWHYVEAYMKEQGKQKMVTMLKRSVKEWNAWRDEHQEITPDLSESNRHGPSRREANFSHAHLSYADLSYADLREANLFGADLLAPG